MGREDIEIGDEAVERATGRDWDGWKRWIDERGGRELGHREIVALLEADGGVESGWWQQMVTNAYEKLIDRRATGETQDAGFQVGVRKTLAAPPADVWAWVTGPEGLSVWLGEADQLRLEAGSTFTLADGATGEVRVLEPENRVRLTWRPEGWPRASTLQLRVTSHDDPLKSVLSFHQEHIPDADRREERREHFRSALRAVEEAVPQR